MSQVVPPKESKAEEVDKDIGSFGMWVNDHIVGNPITFVICILAVILVYAIIPFQVVMPIGTLALVYSLIRYRHHLS